MHEIRDGSSGVIGNVYYTKIPDAIGTLYTMHGYAGSPVEPIMRIAISHAIKSGFNIVAIENVQLSVTYPIADRDLGRMNLDRHVDVLHRGLNFTKCISELNQCGYNIAWLHSLGARAFTDLFVESPHTGSRFNSVVFNNPYFMPPARVEQKHEKSLKSDPSGMIWEKIMDRPYQTTRIIDDEKYTIPATLRNVFFPFKKLPDGRFPTFTDVMGDMSRFAGRRSIVCFILGTDDTEAEYNKNMDVFNALQIHNKDLYLIPNGIHTLENVLPEYDQITQVVLAKLAADAKLHRR